MVSFMQRFSPSRIIIILSLILAIVLAVQFGDVLRPSKSASLSILQTSNIVEPTLMRLRLDVKEYLIVQDKKYIFDFEEETKRFLSLLDTLEDTSKNAPISQSIKALRTDMQNFDTLFKKIVAIEEENKKIESNVFSQYNATLEEHPNKILFQSFTDNDPISGNSAAHLLNASLEYKLAVASYSLNNNKFFLIRANELKTEIKKHADKIEVIVDNKDSIKRIKSFKESFNLYSQGFERLADNIQAKHTTVANAFEDVVPRMMNNSQMLASMLEKNL
jgi:hypothetical protein